MSNVLVFVLELIGTAAFAVSGAIVGIKKQMDLFGVIVLGVCTAVGGGIVRDVILGVTPPATFHDPVYTLTAAAVSVLMFLPHVRARVGRHEPVFDRLLLVMDAVGLGVFTVVGVQCAYRQAEHAYAVPDRLRRTHHRRGRRRAARRVLRRAALYLRAALLRLRIDHRRADLRAVLEPAGCERGHALRRGSHRCAAPAGSILPLEPAEIRLSRRAADNYRSTDKSRFGDTTMNQKKLNSTAIIRETAVLTAAVAIIAAAVFFFLSPSHTSVSSISGLGIVLSNFIPLPLSAITMILNIVLLIIGFLTCGKEFGAKTVYTSVMLPVFLGLFELVFPDYTSMTGSQELDVLCYILVVSIGLSILFNRNASSGGLDIVAKIMNKYLHVELGKAMSISGMCVALSSALIYDKKAVVLSVLGTYFNGIVLDHFIFGQNVKRRVCIITKYEEEVRRFILHELHSGATFYEAVGAYNMQKYREIITIVDKNEYQKLMNYVSKKDPEAFVTVYTVSDMRYRPKVKSF